MRPVAEKFKFQTLIETFYNNNNRDLIRAKKDTTLEWKSLAKKEYQLSFYDACFLPIDGNPNYLYVLSEDFELTYQSISGPLVVG